MKCQELFSLGKKKIKMLSVTVVIGALRIKIETIHVSLKCLVICLNISCSFFFCSTKGSWYICYFSMKTYAEDCHNIFYHWEIRKMSQRMTKPTKWHVCSVKTDQAGHPPNLIRVFTVCLKKLGFLATECTVNSWSYWADTHADLSLYKYKIYHTWAWWRGSLQSL